MNLTNELFTPCQNTVIFTVQSNQNKKELNISRAAIGRKLSEQLALQWKSIDRIILKSSNTMIRNH